jgi:catalase
MFARFSQVAGELGSADTVRDPRGFAHRDVMHDTDREHLAHNIVAHAGDGVSEPVQRRVVEYWSRVDEQLGANVAAGLGSALPLLD